ncbi:MAG: hypothetical protein WDN72_00040 [Alphaproteobacteria bacterium]
MERPDRRHRRPRRLVITACAAFDKATRGGSIFGHMQRVWSGAWGGALAAITRACGRSSVPTWAITAPATCADRHNRLGRREPGAAHPARPDRHGAEPDRRQPDARRFRRRRGHAGREPCRAGAERKRSPPRRRPPSVG